MKLSVDTGEARINPASMRVLNSIPYNVSGMHTLSPSLFNPSTVEELSRGAQRGGQLRRGCGQIVHEGGGNFPRVPPLLSIGKRSGLDGRFLPGTRSFPVGVCGPAVGAD